MRKATSHNAMSLEIEAQIRKCEERLYTAMLASDVLELDALIADNLLFVGSTGDLATKAMDLELHRTGGTQFHELVPKELKIRVCGDRTVLAVAKVFLSGSFLGNAFAGDHRYLRMWQNGEDGWQIVGGSVSPMA
jgi:hypothetical protein